MARMASRHWNRDPCSNKITSKTFFWYAHSNTYLFNCSLILASDSHTSAPDASPNIYVSPFDAAFPGTLPVRTIWSFGS
jgi:hypothetical protein